MAYGGLRGAIAYGLATSLSDKFPCKDTIMMATIAVIFVTVFVQVQKNSQFLIKQLHTNVTGNNNKTTRKSAKSKEGKC
jgi:NhaP-type Na+/H+ or K+/H+ antiporter